MKGLGFLYIIRGVIFYLFFSQVIFGEHFLEGKRRTDPNLIYQIGNPTLGDLSYLHVGVELGGIRIETNNGSGSWLGGTW